MARSFLARLRVSETGATSLEYALIGAGVSIAIIVAVTSIGRTTRGTFQGLTVELMSTSPDEGSEGAE